jgi:peptidyl-dipeptidase A
VTRTIAIVSLLLAAGCVEYSQPEFPPTPTGARDFVASASAELADLAEKSSRANWLSQNFITYDTERLSGETRMNYVAKQTAAAAEAARWNDVEVDPDIRRQLDLMRTSITLPAPSDPDLTAETTEIVTRMRSNYGKSKYCPTDNEAECLSITEIEKIHTESRDADELLDVWKGWRTTSTGSRADYERFAKLMNQGAQELGFEDTGELWRSGYDMDPDAFADELDRLWGQVLPLYESLHCYTRKRLADHYGEDAVPLDQPIPAHLLGNIWAQDWVNIYDLLAPQDADPGYDITKLLQAADYDALEMVHSGEDFFTSLGFEPLPETFWERSLFTKPRDREVVCHASAWNVDGENDLRIKMCTNVDGEDFRTVHHELGHSFYQRAYNTQPYLYRGSANDGFHEAIGDAIALSITPKYLVDIGLLHEEPPRSKDIGLLLHTALDKIAFLPFGLLVDRWRWAVFNGDISPDEYNAAWWELREKYQGVAAPVARSEADFDPGAKYHVPNNTSYSRYFLAHILQFQFHREMCAMIGNEDPLNRCTIYGSKEAGAKLAAMLEMGKSRPWPDALEALTGSREMDASSVVDYFAPLQAWLDEQNEGLVCGW